MLMCLLIKPSNKLKTRFARFGENKKIENMVTLYFFLPGFCDKALPAAVFENLLVLLSLKVLLAALAALGLVTFLAFDFCAIIFMII